MISKQTILDIERETGVRHVTLRRKFNTQCLSGGGKKEMRAQKYKRDLQRLEKTAQYKTLKQFKKDGFKLKKNDGVMFNKLIDRNQKIINKYEGGTNLLRYTAILYLLAKHKNDCTPFQPFENDAMLTWYSIWPDYLLDTHDDGQLFRTALYGNERDDRFVPELNTRNAKERTKLSKFKATWNKKCGSSKIRFIFVFLLIGTGRLEDHISHANVLIYDRKRKELERFEPHGGMTDAWEWCDNVKDFNNTRMAQRLPNRTCDGESLDRAIVKHLKPIIGFETYFNNQTYCPNIGPQARQSLKRQGVDPGGFCQYWSIWYIDLRLSNPDTPRKTLVSNAMKNINNVVINKKGYMVDRWTGQGTSDFGEFIRAYATFMELLVRIIREATKYIHKRSKKWFIKKLMDDMVAEFTDDA